jgi:hypothetical protein
VPPVFLSESELRTLKSFHRFADMNANQLLCRLLLVFLLFSARTITAQNPVASGQSQPLQFNTRNGLGFVTTDSSFSLNMRFRIQSRFGYTSLSDDELEPESFDIRVRRCRLRFDGFVFNPRLTYNLQLSFSRADMDWDNSQVPNVLRDAMVNYRMSEHFSIGFGQGKLPGNRQRVISSGALQFTDRSIVNSALTLDRDVGLFANWQGNQGNVFYILKTAITAGEGRNPTETGKGLAYTARLEILPLGRFTDDGDYFEGDLVREQKPKLSLAGVIHWNNDATRTQGQLGKSLYSPRDLFAWQADALFKYKGLALCSEYLYRSTDSSLTVSPEDSTQIRYVVSGWGVNTQLSYCFATLWEIALRHSYLEPDQSISAFEDPRTQFALGVTKYLSRHKVKLQSDITYELPGADSSPGFYQVRFQVEVGI